LGGLENTRRHGVFEKFACEHGRFKSHSLSFYNCKKCLQSYPFKSCWNIDETVEIYELPSDPHECAIAKFLSLLDQTAAGLNGFTRGSPRLGTAAIGDKEPDVAFTPDGRPPAGVTSEGGAWPTLIVEVGWSETHDQLIADKNFWLSAATGVQIVIIIRIFARVGRANPPSVPMLMIQFVRGNAVPTAVVSFGTRPLHYQTIPVTNALGGPAITGVLVGGGACNAPGLVPYQVQLPTALLFTGAPIPVVLAGVVNVGVDLFRVQQHVLKAFS